jgi:HAE1 family hydrophobic/amphiphilic exporter-1
MLSLHSIYSSPKKVFLIFILLSIWGIFSFFQLPVYLFPNTQKPKIFVDLNIASMSPSDFYSTYGANLERELKSIFTQKLRVEKVKGEYSERNVNIEVEFGWGANSLEAKNEVERVARAAVATMPENIRNTLWVNLNQRNSGFFALSYYSNKREAREVYEIVEPKIMPRLAEVQEAQSPFLYNPKMNSLLINMKLASMLMMGFQPEDIRNAVSAALKSYTAGQVPVGPGQISVYFPPELQKVSDFKNLIISNSKGNTAALSDLAEVIVGISESSQQVFKTSGFSSLILYSAPKPEGNIKKMSEEILKIVKEIQKELPSDIQYKVLVDPSEFIGNAISHVGWEVMIASGLAVLVLFLFMGSFRNVITAAIEIPLSIIFSFILMMLFKVPLNLISLGGFALAAGMNVDASIVVMENIFRLFGEKAGSIKTFNDRLNLIVQAVREVRTPIISSTLISLVVFTPLMMTSSLSSAILGDLAKAVIYSHGLCIVISLFLVPVIRLFTLKSSANLNFHSSPMDKSLFWFSNHYAKILNSLLKNKNKRAGLYLFCFVSLLISVFVISPRLQREIMAQPNSDWVMVGVSLSSAQAQDSRRLLYQVEQLDSQIRTQYPKEVDYTYLQNSSNYGNIMVRLKDKKFSENIKKEFENKFVDTPFIKYRIRAWNPSEISLPDPPHLSISIRGGDSLGKREIAREIVYLFQEKKLFDRIGSDPDYNITRNYVLKPRQPLLHKLVLKYPQLSPSQLSHSLYLFDKNDYLSDLVEQSTTYPISLQWKKDSKNILENLNAIPIKLESKIYPLSAFYDIHLENAEPPLQTENLRALFSVTGRVNDDKLMEKNDRQQSAKKILEEWKEKNATRKFSQYNLANYLVNWEDADQDLTEALHQLAISMLTSLLLVWVILYWQFNSWKSSCVVLLAIPFAITGAMISLYIFKSTLSLNSALGIILLNGIAVANSLLIVDFMDHKVASGLPPNEAAVEASLMRLRPILITSLTSILGMLPVALGWGDGGKVLQPLGIAVSGGLWISMCLTLLVVPVLYANILKKGKSHVAV